MRFKRDGVKKTKKYRQVSKLQANIKGYLFRQRRKKALAKLQSNKLDFDDEEEFDAEKFFGIKEDQIVNGLKLPEEEMMR